MSIKTINPYTNKVIRTIEETKEKAANADAQHDMENMNMSKAIESKDIRRKDMSI